MAFASIPFADLIVESGESELRAHASSTQAERWFCSRCGTPLWVQDREVPRNRDFSLATLDDPLRVVPQFHMFWDSRIDWDQPGDDLPRFPRTRAEGGA